VCVSISFRSLVQPYFNMFVSIFIQSYVNIKLHVSTLYRSQALVFFPLFRSCNRAIRSPSGQDISTDTQYFFIFFVKYILISQADQSLNRFYYFNMFVSIFIQSYVNIKLHVSTLYRSQAHGAWISFPPLPFSLLPPLFSKFSYKSEILLKINL
jgi:hypothetical protein